MICRAEQDAAGMEDRKTSSRADAQPDCRPGEGPKRGRINVLFITDQLCNPGGAERVLLNTIRGLPQNRFYCQLATFKLNPQEELFSDPPCPVHVFPLRRTYDLNAWKAARQIRHLIRQAHIDIVHTFHETSDLWGGLIAKASGCPVLVSSRRDMGFLRSAKHEFGYRILNRCFDKILSVSEQVRQRCLQAESLASSKVVTLYNGVDLARVDSTPLDTRLRLELGIANRAPLITTVGHIRRIKGIDILIQAAHLVRRHVPEAVFLIVGNTSEPDYHAELMRLIADLNLGQNVKFLGSRNDVISVLKASQIFCLPSRSEGFSNALLEAMACSLPCIATDVGGNPEAIRNGIEGCLVASDPQQIADRILGAIRRPAIAHGFGQAARRRVEQQFTFETMISQLVALYDELVSKVHDNTY